MLDFETSKSTWGLEIKIMENLFSLENYVTSEGAVLTMFYTINLSHYSLPSMVYGHNYFE